MPLKNGVKLAGINESEVKSRDCLGRTSTLVDTIVPSSFVNHDESSQTSGGLTIYSIRF